MSWAAPKLDLARVGTLTFDAPDLERFPAISVARQALEAGGNAPAAMNAANEAAVAAFLDRRIGFLDIAATVAETLNRMNAKGEVGEAASALEEAMMTDASARRVAAEVLPQFERL
jgi:1-deoxy-D-xylulose-5-phosphate reductoisomerase